MAIAAWSSPEAFTSTLHPHHSVLHQNTITGAQAAISHLIHRQFLVDDGDVGISARCELEAVIAGFLGRIYTEAIAICDGNAVRANDAVYLSQEQIVRGASAKPPHRQD
jgi:hypothetical protein